MVQVTLEQELDAVLSQMSADLDLPRPEVARVLLESALLQGMTR